MRYGNDVRITNRAVERESSKGSKENTVPIVDTVTLRGEGVYVRLGYGIREKDSMASSLH